MVGARSLADCHRRLFGVSFCASSNAVRYGRGGPLLGNDHEPPRDSSAEAEGAGGVGDSPTVRMSYLGKFQDLTVTPREPVPGAVKDAVACPASRQGEWGGETPEHVDPAGQT
jgi:hypothetical protein